MAKEYVTNHEDSSEEYKIDWDKVEYSVQQFERDLNTLDADYAVDHEIYCDYYGDQVGYLHFSEFKNVNANNVHPSLPNKTYEKLLYINNVLVNAEFRGWGFGTSLYDKFGEIYKEDFEDWPIAQVFVNPIAEYTFMKRLEDGDIPKDAYIPELTTRDYDSNEKQQAKDLFKWLPRGEQSEFKDEMEQLKQEGSSKVEWLKNLKTEKFAAINDILDARGIEINYFEDREAIPEDELEEIEAAGITNLVRHHIGLLDKSGTEIGYMDFTQVENCPPEVLNLDIEGIIEKVLFIDMVKVNDDFQNNGFGYRIYEEFGKIYSQSFSGWPVSRNFANPVAEYTYRKAVDAGLVPEDALTEDYITRSYYKDETKELAQDLRQKLPENRRGPENWAFRKDFRKIIAAASDIDLRNLTFETKESKPSNYFNTLSMEINAILDGKSIGYIDLSIEPDDEIIEVDLVEVEDEYQGLGIGTLLYKEFGKLYESQYNGWGVARYFVNPVAEYAFRKAVSLGWVSEQAITEKHIKRNYDEDERQLAQDLRQKLPEHLRGPETWALRKDYRMKKQAEGQQVDLRHCQFKK